MMNDSLGFPPLVQFSVSLYDNKCLVICAAGTKPLQPHSGIMSASARLSLLR